MKETDLRLIQYWKKEERERILGVMELYVTWFGGSSYEQYAKKKILELRDIIERDIKE